MLQPATTMAITQAVLREWAELGFARLSMESVAKRAGVGKSALYRRWPSKQEMAMAVLADHVVPLAVVPDTGSLRGDVRKSLDALTEWMTDPLLSRILPDLVAEMARNPELAAFTDTVIGTPRRELARAKLLRAVDRGELRPDVDLELALDLLAASLYWRLSVRAADLEPGYHDKLTDLVMRAIGV